MSTKENGGITLDGKWRTGRRIGAGSFGEIYYATGPNGEPAAVKFEKKSVRCPQLRHECKVYRELADCVGICNIHYFGSHGDDLTMVMDFLGPSLEELFTKCGRRFTLRTTLQLADQMLERIDMMHMHHLIHRDIKPANFVIGAPLERASDDPKGRRIYAIDFGLSKRYRHPRNLAHIPYRDGRSLTGTPRYASINNHMGIETSRRDDLESIGYVLIYFLVGKLPWQGLRSGNAAQKHQLILEKKMSTSIEELCAGCPRQLIDYLRYCRALKFDAKPNIAYLRSLFRDLYKERFNSDYTFEWDWEQPQYQPQPCRALSTSQSNVAERNNVPKLVTAPSDTPNAGSQNAMGAGQGSSLNQTNSATLPTHALTEPKTQHASSFGASQNGSRNGTHSLEKIGNSPSANNGPKEEEGGTGSLFEESRRRNNSAPDLERPRSGGAVRPKATSRAPGLASLKAQMNGADSGSSGNLNQWKLNFKQQQAGNETQAAWGTSRNTTNGTNGAPNLERPSSASGLEQQNSSNSRPSTGNAQSTQQGSHMVVGSRSLMRYRRNRPGEQESSNTRSRTLQQSGSNPHMQPVSNVGDHVRSKSDQTDRPSGGGGMSSYMRGTKNSSSSASRMSAKAQLGRPMSAASRFWA